jgi:hypothetical protein
MCLINDHEDATSLDLVVQLNLDTLAMTRLANPVRLECEKSVGVDVA